MQWVALEDKLGTFRTSDLFSWEPHQWILPIESCERVSILILSYASIRCASVERPFRHTLGQLTSCEHIQFISCAQQLLPAVTPLRYKCHMQSSAHAAHCDCDPHVTINLMDGEAVMTERKHATTPPIVEVLPCHRSDSPHQPSSQDPSSPLNWLSQDHAVAQFMWTSWKRWASCWTQSCHLTILSDNPPANCKLTTQLIMWQQEPCSQQQEFFKLSLARLKLLLLW